MASGLEPQTPSEDAAKPKEDTEPSANPTRKKYSTMIAMMTLIAHGNQNFNDCHLLPEQWVTTKVCECRHD